MQFADKDNHGLKTFLKEVLDIELMDYQLNIARLLMGNRNICCVTGRQVGKDTVIGAFTLWRSVVKPNFRTVIVSAGQRQSDMLQYKMANWMASSDQLVNSVYKSSREELTLKNGSTTYYLPASGLIRGYSDIDLVVVNEARDCGEEVWDAVMPMLSRRAGLLAVFSTPLWRLGRLWEMWNSPLYEHVHIASSQNIHLPPDYIEKERERMSNQSYQTEYMGEFMASAQNFFDRVSIQKALQRYDMVRGGQPVMQYSIGIDWDRVQDASVMTVVSRDEGKALRVEYIKSFEGVSFSDQLPYVPYLKHAFEPVAIIPESNGLGLGPCDALERSGMKITRFHTTNESKTRLLDNLRSKFDRREITIPVEPFRLQHELALPEYDSLPSGAIRIGSPSGGHDDHVMSLALACWGFTQAKPIHLNFLIESAPSYQSAFGPAAARNRR